MTPMIRAIKTTYRGVLFMSTLEADWASSLDHLRPAVAWQYEPEGFRLSDGQNYRCDFFLPRIGTWLEVKGPHDQRIDKPATFSDALAHAPGCDEGRPVETFKRPPTLPAAACGCGYGPEFPWQNLIVGRPATSGKLTWEPPHSLMARGARIVALSCVVCGQYSFIDANGLLACRRCHSDARGSKAFPSGSLPFAKVEPPRGPSRRKRAA